jgi:hypothetical protein
MSPSTRALLCACAAILAAMYLHYYASAPATFRVLESDLSDEAIVSKLSVRHAPVVIRDTPVAPPDLLRLFRYLYLFALRCPLRPGAWKRVVSRWMLVPGAGPDFAVDIAHRAFGNHVVRVVLREHVLVVPSGYAVRASSPAAALCVYDSGHALLRPFAHALL